MKTSFSLWELAHREFPVSYTGFGFAVHIKYFGIAIDWQQNTTGDFMRGEGATVIPGATFIPDSRVCLKNANQ